MSIGDLRKEYMQRGLSESDVDADPIAQFRAWFAEELASAPIEPNAMTLATASADGRPSARMVLLKGFDAAGFVFYTNYDSRKGLEIEGNPWAALVFYWPELERQVRVEGRVERVTPEQSDAYFDSRPPGSQLGAWASHQSAAIPDRATLERAQTDAAERFAGQAISRPPYWGGYRVVPRAIEFWQGRQDRLHDRLRYERGDGGWTIARLSP